MKDKQFRYLLGKFNLTIASSFPPLKEKLTQLFIQMLLTEEGKVDLGKVDDAYSVLMAKGKEEINRLLQEKKVEKEEFPLQYFIKDLEIIREKVLGKSNSRNGSKN